MNHKTLAGLVPLLGLIAACSVLPKGAPNFSVHDFGALAPASQQTLPFPIRSLEVIPAPWLASTTMQYRLGYALASHRQAFVNSRWAAQPGQMLDVLIKRSVRANVSPASVSGCRLRVDLDEFIQLFDSETMSHGVIEARAALLAPRTDQLLAVSSFSIARAAPSADAEGGVAALHDGVRALNQEMLAWLATLASSGIGARCGV